MTTPTGMLEFDEATSRMVEEIYGTADVVGQRRRLVQALRPRPHERVLDIGSGPGFLACEIAEAVGPTGSVTGIDLSPDMNALAQRRIPATGAAPVSFTIADATALPFADGSFDATVSTQVYEYVADMPAALAEARRVLVPGGRLLVLDTDWDSVVWRSSDDDRMRRVLGAWDEHLVHRELPRRLPQLLREAGFALERCEVVPLLNVGYRRETYSGIGLEGIAGYAAGRQGLTAEETDAWASDLQALGEDYFFSINRYLFLATR